MDPRDYIDDFEGREEPKEMHAECASCGKRVKKLYRTYWTDELVGACCVLHSDEFPEQVFSNQPTPAQVLAAIEASPTVEAVQAAFRLIEPLQGELFPRREMRYSVWAFEPSDKKGVA